MSPRPAPDLHHRRRQVLHTAHEIAESEGWAAVTMRRLAAALGVTQPVLYSAYASRQSLIDAVALTGYVDLAAELEAVESAPLARIRTYLDFAANHPRMYEAMFSMPSGLPFATDDVPEPLRRAFAGVREAFPDADGTRAEVAWATLHGLATLQAGGRLRPGQALARLALVDRMLSTPQTP